MTRKTLYPVTRLHEPLRVEVEVERGRVTDAWVSALLFRGFELMIEDHDPRDAPLFLQRICGICSSAHAVAAAYAMQSAFGMRPPPNGQHLTNLIMAADLIQNHLRHFYLLVLPDYVRLSSEERGGANVQRDIRLPEKANRDLLTSRREGIRAAVRAHEMMAVFGAKAPHQQTILAGGVTETARSDQLMAFGAILRELGQFAEKVFFPDVLTVAEYYPDYYSIGAGKGNFLSFGMFPQPGSGERALRGGVVKGLGETREADEAMIGESVRYGWYEDEPIQRHPKDGKTKVNPDQTEGYSFVKAPRYEGEAMEGGPLARGWMNGYWRRGISTMDRLLARARETVEICRLAEGWLEEVTPGGPTHVPNEPLDKGTGAGLTDAMRGPLGHWIDCREGRVRHYQIVTPTAWNFSPRDEHGRRGLVEEALIGTPVADEADLVEVGRVIRSLDPCMICAVHLYKG